MGQTIKIDQLADTVMKGMEEYAKLAADDLKKDVKKAGDTVKKQMNGGSGLSPSAKWSYAKGIASSASICITSSCVILLPPDFDNALRGMTADRTVIGITTAFFSTPCSVIDNHSYPGDPDSNNESQKQNLHHH